MAGKKVIIRTLDIGADKQAGYFGLDKEENPALGYRTIRICLTRKEIFKAQLRASVFGTVSIMFPMIISVREVRYAKEVLEECKAELKERGADQTLTETYRFQDNISTAFNNVSSHTSWYPPASILCQKIKLRF